MTLLRVCAWPSGRTLVAALALLSFSSTSGAQALCIAPGALQQLRQEVQPKLDAADDDKRFVLPRERSALAAFDHVGAVAIKDKISEERWLKTGSGTLVTACHVLTSYHVVFPDLAPFSTARRVAFSFGAAPVAGAPFKYVAEGTPIDIGLYDPARPVHSLDQVLIRLARRASSHYEKISIADVDVKDFGSAEVFACGYPGNMDVLDGAAQSLFCDVCQIKGYHYLRGYETNCTMPAGTSGGAVFRMLKDRDCDPALRVALIGAPNQSPEAEIFPKNHPRIRSYVSDYNKALAAIKRIIDADDCSGLPEVQAQAPAIYGHQPDRLR